MLLLLTTKTRLNLKAGHLRIPHPHPFSEVKAPDTDYVCMCVELNLIWGERGLVEQLEPGVRGSSPGCCPKAPPGRDLDGPAASGQGCLMVPEEVLALEEAYLRSLCEGTWHVFQTLNT